MLKDSISPIDQKNVDSITRCISHLYVDPHFNNEAYGLTEIANATGVTTEYLLECYGSRSGLMIKVIEYVENLCQEEIFDAMADNTQLGIKKILRLAKLIEDFFKNHPESSYWFKAKFCSDVVLTGAYPRLIQFFKKWEDQIRYILSDIISGEFVDIVATTYFDNIKACLFIEDGFGAYTNLFYSKYFLWRTVARILNQNFD